MISPYFMLAFTIISFAKVLLLASAKKYLKSASTHQAYKLYLEYSSDYRKFNRGFPHLDPFKWMYTPMPEVKVDETKLDALKAAFLTQEDYVKQVLEEYERLKLEHRIKVQSSQMV